MARALAPVAALLVSVAFLLTGNGLQGTLLPVRAQIEQFSTLSIGIMGSAYYVGFAAGCILGPRVVQHAGHIRTFTAMAAIASAVPLAHLLAPIPAVWWPMRALTGFCLAVLFIVIESWLNERSTNETRGTVLSVYLIINLTVITAGQMLLTIHDPSSFQVFAVAAILASLAAVPVALTGSMAPAPVEAVQVRPRRLYELSPVAFVGCFAVGLANGAFWALAPVFGARAGLDVTGIAVLMSITVLGGALGQWPMGRLSDRGDRRKVFVLACAGAIGTGAIMAVTRTEVGPWLYAFSAGWGFFAFPLYAIAMAHANDHAEPSEYVEVSSGLLLVFGAGAVLGPMLGSAAIAAMGPRGLYAYTVVVHIGVTAFTIWRMRLRDPVPEKEHVPFDESIQSALTVSPVFDTEELAEARVAAEPGAETPEPEEPNEEPGDEAGEVTRRK